MDKKKNSKYPKTTQKYRIINRILTHSQLFSENELKEKSLKQLTQIQDKSLIAAAVKIKFKHRHNKK